MSSYDRINELKKIGIIFSRHKVKKEDLLLKDEDGVTFLDYIIKKKIFINDPRLICDISNDYDLLSYMFSKKYFLPNYDNVDLLFDESRGMSLIELIFTTSPRTVSTLDSDIIGRLFINNSGKYLIEKFIDMNQYACVGIIKKVTNFDLLYDCLNGIGRLDMLVYSNENCLLTKLSDGRTLLETLIDNGYTVDAIDMTYRVADILYNKGQYDELLKLDCKILLNYPDSTNNYLNLLIQKYKEGENVPFEEKILSSSENRYVALANITLLRNGISYRKPYSLISLLNISNEKPVIIHMLEMDKDLTIQYYGYTELMEELHKYIAKFKQVEISDVANIDINNDNVSDYLVDIEKFKTDLLAGKITKITQSDLYREDFMKTLDNGITILEYAFTHDINVYFSSPYSVEELLTFLKCNKTFLTISAKLLYEPVDNGKKVIDYLMENKRFNTIRSSNGNDLRIIDYCIKYNDFSAISYDILEELLVEDKNGNFLIEKYLNNDNFFGCFQVLQLADSKALKLYQKGYKKIILYGNLELLMNYPSKEQNYLSELIDDYNKGVDIRFETRSYICNDKELMARCYIQMAKNGLVGYLDDLNEEHFLDKGSGAHSLLYYLMTLDKTVTLDEILTVRMRKKPRICSELKVLGGDGALLNVAYEKYDCDRICRKMYDDEYASDFESPVPELLEELRQLFYNDGKSDKDLIDALVISYKYLTSVNPIFISELQQLIQIKKNNPNFCYIKEYDSGYFNKIRGVVVDDTTISTLNHETGHAMHSFLTDEAVPSGYGDLIQRISLDATFIDMVDQYSKRYQQIFQSVKKSADDVVGKYISSDVAVDDVSIIDSMLSREREKIIRQYKEKGYSEETLDIVLSGTFTVSEFLDQKSKIEKSEVIDLILRYDYDAFVAIGDIIDAITNGKFRSNVLKNAQGEVIKSAYGHGIRYYAKDGDTASSINCRFSEMIANYALIIKSKHSVEMLEYLRSIVGDELVEMLDKFYMEKIVCLSMENDKGVTR